MTFAWVAGCDAIPGLSCHERESAMSERRHELRKKLMAFTPVYQANHEELLGYLGNLTLQGAMLVSENPLEVDRRLTLLIEFPGDTQQHMTIPAHVVRCVPDESPRCFLVGCEFSEVTPVQAGLIQALLERYHFRHQIEPGDEAG